MRPGRLPRVDALGAVVALAAPSSTFSLAATMTGKKVGVVATGAETQLPAPGINLLGNEIVATRYVGQRQTARRNIIQDRALLFVRPKPSALAP